MIRRLFNALRGTLWACAVTILVFFPLMVIELVFFGLLGLSPNLKTYSWLIAVCVGGYFACRQAKSSPWMSLAVFAAGLESLVILGVPDANDTLSELYPNLDPAAVQWHYLTMIVLTVPAALFGGFLWSRSPSSRAGNGLPAQSE
jgi:hypothetical protein